MAQPLVLEKWPGKVCDVKIGATPSEGGSRARSLVVGGESTLPFLFNEGSMPHKPIVAMEIWDIAPLDWPEESLKPFGTAVKDPLAWAAECVGKYKAELLCVKLQGAHPDFGNKSPADETKFIQKLLEKITVPLIIIGCADEAVDTALMPAVCEAAKGQRLIIGSAVQDNYKTIAAAALADGHVLIAESPIDINIAKQLNILISDLGMPFDRLVMNPTIGALGYGLEYAYSIMERARLAALAGDKTLALPFICFVGQETWRTKEARASIEEFPSWGAQENRGIVWEAMTAAALLQAGADILVMRHPKAIEKVNKYIHSLMMGGG